MLIYCSHKFGGDKSNLSKAAKIIHDLQISDTDNTYVSPLHCFSYLDYAELDTELELCLCEDLLMACDELLVLSELSYGVEREIERAKLWNIPIKYYKEDK